MLTMSVTSLTRRQVRYWLFRKFNEANGGASSEGAPSELINSFEGMAAFSFCGGWASFGNKWDISTEEPWGIVPLEKSLLAQWNEYCEKNAREFTPKEKAVIRAEEKPVVVDDVIYDINVSKDGKSTTRKWKRKRKNR